jgi:hypothetical protein
MLQWLLALALCTAAPALGEERQLRQVERSIALHGVHACGSILINLQSQRNIPVPLQHSTIQHTTAWHTKANLTLAASRCRSLPTAVWPSLLLSPCSCSC